MKTETPIKIKKEKTRSKDYVDNAVFYQAMVDYGISVRRAQRLKQPKPRPSEYIGECLLKIGNGLASKPNFSKYVFKDDMIGDGLENCLKYIGNFNPKKYKNPFSYFTQIIYFAFLRRITSEKKKLVLKYKMIENSPFFSELTQQSGDGSTYHNAYIKFLKANMGDIITDFEDKKTAKKLKNKKKNNLEKILVMEDEIPE